MTRYGLSRRRSQLLLAIALAGLGLPRAGFAQPATAGVVASRVMPLAGAKQKIAMVSLLKGGEVVEQSEVLTGSARTLRFAASPGEYEIRAEGDGIVTTVKRGIRVVAGKQTQISFQPQAGAGVHVVEYSGATQDDTGARLARLEAALPELRNGVQQNERSCRALQDYVTRVNNSLTNYIMSGR